MTEQHYNYIRRSGRMTKSQSSGYDDVRSQYHCEISEWNGRSGKLGIEIGFGMGQGLLQWALDCPDWQLLGIELYKPGVGALAQGLRQGKVTNVAIIEEPAQIVFAALQPGSVGEVRIYFPDPWPKKRHAKRRLIQPDFITAIAGVLATDGVLKIATDWDPYAEWIREVMSQQSRLECTLDVITEPDSEGSDSTAQPRASDTKFERRGRDLGHRIHDLIYVPGKNSATTESR